MASSTLDTLTGRDSFFIVYYCNILLRFLQFNLSDENMR
jgi:hypothetical protein